MNRQGEEALQDVIRAAQMLSQSEGREFIQRAVQLITECFQSKNKVLVAGNGGSLCDAMHFVEELTGQFRRPRPALAAIALSDPSHMSCVGNDFGFAEVFARGVEALGVRGDLLVVLSTSGSSPNIIRAVEQAKMQELKTIALLGKTGGRLKGMCEVEWVVSGFRYSDRIQEAHMAALHIIVEQVEYSLFGVHEAVECQPVVS